MPTNVTDGATSNKSKNPVDSQIDKIKDKENTRTNYAVKAKPSGIFQSIDSGIGKIKSAFSEGGIIDNVKKVAKVTGLAALGIGGFILSEKLKMADTISSLKDFLEGGVDKINKVIDPSYKAKIEEPIYIPTEGEIEKPIPEGDKEAKSDNRKATVEKTAAIVTTKVALDNASKMGKLTDRTKNIMSTYGLDSISSVQSITTASPVISSVEEGSGNTVTSEDIQATYQSNGGNTEKLLAANNELLGIISQQIELVHSTQAASIQGKLDEATLMQVLSANDQKEAIKIQENNNSIESVTDTMLKNMAKAENQSNENAKKKSDGQEVHDGLSSKLPSMGDLIGNITKLAIPLLIKKSYDILTEKENSGENADNNKDLNANKDKYTDADGNQIDPNSYYFEGPKGIGHWVGDILQFLSNWGVKLAKVLNPAHWITAAVDNMEDGFLKTALTGLTTPMRALDKIPDLIGMGWEKVADAAHASSNDVIYDENGEAHYVTKVSNEELAKQGLVQHSDGNIYTIEDAKKYTEQNIKPTVRYTRDSNTGKFVPVQEGDDDKVVSSGSSKNKPYPRSTKTTKRGIGRSINLDSLDKNKQRVSFGGRSNPLSSGSTDVPLNVDWSPTQVNTEEIKEPPAWTGEDESAGQAVANEMMRLDSKITYSQAGTRNPYDEAGTSDCSSTCRWVMKKTIGIDPGYNSVSQILNNQGIWVDRSDIDENGIGKGKVPDESKLKPGDLLFIRPTRNQDTSRPYRVGHVEMYVGNGKIMGQTGEAKGHKGPVFHTIGKDAWINNGYIGAKRFILSNEAIQDLYNIPEMIRLKENKPSGSKQVSGSGHTPSSNSATELPTQVPITQNSLKFPDFMGTIKHSSGTSSSGSQSSGNASNGSISPYISAPNDNRVTDNRVTTITNNNDNSVTNNYYGNRENPDLNN